MPRPRLNALCRAALAALFALSFAACGDDEVEQNNSTCSIGEQYNPILGSCVPIQSTNNNGADAGNVDPGDSGNTNNISPGDMGGNNNTTDAGMVDMAPGRCDEGVDQDNDGLDNACECELNTSPVLADTDQDGLEDGVEDANGNCQIDIGVETDPRRADTDNDGLTDFEETNGPTDPLNPDADMDGVLDGAEVASGCMDPFESDTDMDGIPDAVEDNNQDGMIGTCPNRMFEYACAQGESDPCSVDSDGDGTPDSDEAQYRQCRPEDTQNLPTANTVSNMTADYQIVLDNSATAQALTGADGHVFYDTADAYTGFVVSLTPTGMQTNPSLIADDIVSRVQGAYPAAVRRLSGRRITTHDGYSATVGTIIDLPAGTDLDAARDAVLGNLLGGAPAPAVTSGLTGDASETLFIYQILSRGPGQYIIVGAFTTLTNYQDNAADTGFRVDDLVGGTAVATAMETNVTECVAYKITTRPKVDIIISIDGSGSMSDEQQALQNFAVDFTNLLSQSNLDWRAGVTLPNCNGTSDLSMEAAAVLSAHCQGLPFPFPGTQGTGDLVMGDFTTDPMVLKSRLNPSTFSMAGEHALAAVVAAADKALPRSDSDASKFRNDAAVILISITDEEDAWWQDGGSWGNSQNITLTPTQQTELETEGKPWVDFLLKQELGATVFGIVWPTGEQCQPNGAAVAHAVTHIANETGGSVGSICQADITNTLAEIANAAAGIASGLRLRGTPLTPTIEVIRGDAQTGTVSNVVRSRADGFDYDSIVNRILFPGPNPPQTNDTVIIPYRRWDGSVFQCTSTSECPAAQKLKCVDGECR